MQPGGPAANPALEKFLRRLVPYRRKMVPRLVLTDSSGQKLNGSSSTGVQRVFFTTDRNDWLDAW
jgi:hypothetical protein